MGEALRPTPPWQGGAFFLLAQGDRSEPEKTLIERRHSGERSCVDCRNVNGRCLDLSLARAWVQCDLVLSRGFA